MADLEDCISGNIDAVNREIDKGLLGEATPWEGAKTFHARMLDKYQSVLTGREVVQN